MEKESLLITETKGFALLSHIRVPGLFHKTTGWGNQQPILLIHPKLKFRMNSLYLYISGRYFNTGGKCSCFFVKVDPGFRQVQAV